MPTPAELRLRPHAVDAVDYDLEDAAGTVAGASRRWRWTVEGLQELPGAAVVALEGMADALEAAGGAGGDLASLAAGVERRLRELASREGSRTPMLEVLEATHPLVTATEAVDTLLSAAGRAVASADGPRGSGRLARVNLGGGGLPKGEVPSARVTRGGLAGDHQATRRHHGRPFQAVSLYSMELIEALAAEGHPVSAGSLGENLTISGIHWRSLRPGVRLSIGDPADPVCLELTSWAPPCREVARFLAGRDFSRIDHDRHPGWGRAYAVVVREGEVRPGADVVLLP